jgi:hypothetical protein
MAVIYPKAVIVTDAFSVGFGQDQGAFAHDIILLELSRKTSPVPPEIRPVPVVFSVPPHPEVNLVIRF